MHFQTIAAQLQYLLWRDAQFTAISSQLEDAFPTLLDELTAQVDHAKIVDLVRTSLALKASSDSILRQWGTQQLEVALDRAEAALDQTIRLLPGQVNLDSDAWEQVTKALPAVAGFGLIGASIAAVPTVISFATVSTSIFAFWGTAGISWPLFAFGATGIGIATLTGSRSLKFANDKARNTLRIRLHREAGRQVFGLGEKPNADCMLGAIQAAVDQAGRNKIQGALS